MGVIFLRFCLNLSLGFGIGMEGFIKIDVVWGVGRGFGFGVVLNLYLLGFIYIVWW